MYELLIYSGDLTFAVKVSELLYTRTKLSDEEFLSPYAAYYYNHRKNMLHVDMLEATYKAYLNKSNDPFGFVRLDGDLKKIGYKFKQQVMTFVPHTESTEENLDHKIVRRGMTVGRAIHDIRENSRINENEYVLLVALEEETQIKSDPAFNELLHTEGGPTRGFHTGVDKSIEFQKMVNTPFLQKNVSKGKKVKHLMFGLVTDISKDYIIKMYTLPTPKQSADINNPESGLTWVLVRVPVPGFHVQASHSLLEYTSKSCPNPSIAHILFSPPLTHRHYLKKLHETRANLHIHQSQKTKASIKSIVKDLAERLDDTQLRAIQNALCCSLTFIHAPSCSGKMAAIVEIVSSWLKLSTAKILVTCESNKKVDFLHMILCKAGLNSIRVVTSPDNEECDSMSKEFNETVQHLKDNNTYYNAYYIRYPILKKILSSASIVCTSLDSLASEYFVGQSFQRVIVDDASASVEPLVLGALTKNCQHVVMLGDHKLLAPSVTSEYSVSKGFKISLFER